MAAVLRRRFISHFGRLCGVRNAPISCRAIAAVRCDAKQVNKARAPVRPLLSYRGPAQQIEPPPDELLHWSLQGRDERGWSSRLIRAGSVLPSWASWTCISLGLLLRRLPGPVGACFFW